MHSPDLTLSTHPGIAIKQIMATITDVATKISSPQKGKRDENQIDKKMARWLKWLNRQVKPEFGMYNEWPAWVGAQLKLQPCFFGKWPSLSTAAETSG